MEKLKFKKLIVIVTSLASILFIFLVGWEIYYSSTFHVVSLSPGSGNISTISPYIKINFNKPITQYNLSINSSTSIIKSLKVTGKTATLFLEIPLNDKTKYEITIVKVFDTYGKELKNISFYFTPKYEPYSSLSSDQQKTILHQQEQATSSLPPSFFGTDALINEGLTTQQVQDFEQGVTNYAESQNIKSISVVIDQSTVTNEPQNGNGVFAVGFSFTLNRTSYNGTLQFSGLVSAQLTISNSQGTQLYQYGSLNSASDTGSAVSN